MSDTTAIDVSEYEGKVIAAIYKYKDDDRHVFNTTKYGRSVRFAQDAIVIEFTDGAVIAVYDSDQQCCEYRHMSCDDDLQSFVGAKFLGVNETDGPTTGDVHEVQFLWIRTTLGTIVAETHNEHNGYYGGFSVVVTELMRL